MVIELDVTDPETTARVVEIQQAAYAVEAELMKFWGIPQLNETADHVAGLTGLTWRGALSSGVLVGVIAWHVAAGVIDIDRLAVDPAYSRQGHGRQLVQAVPQESDTIVSTGRANTPAKTLYRSEGFVQASEIEVAPGVRTTQFRRKTGSVSLRPR